MHRLHPERRPRRHRVVLLVAAFLAAIPFLAGAARAGDATVVIDNFAFSPSTLTVKAGTTVTFTNVGDLPHDATALKQGDWGTGLLAKGESKTVSFMKPGMYYYICTPHPWMYGQIIVEP